MVKLRTGEPESSLMSVFMKEWTRVARLTAVLLMVALVLTPPAICGAFRNVEVGSAVPDFTLKDLDGMDHTLSAEKGRVVILAFIKADQDKSIKALNALEKVSGTLKNDGLTVWAVANGAEDVSAIKPLVEKLDLEYPILVDADKKLYGEYGLFIFPATAVIDQEGNFSHEYTSYGADYGQAIMDKAKVLLGLMSVEEQRKGTEKKAIVELSESEKEAERNMQMAKVLLDRGFGSKALPKLEKAIELNPALTGARILAGEIYMEDGKNAEARAQFDAVLTDNPKSNEARVGLGSVLIAEGDLDGAEAELQKAIMLNPDPTLALYRLGQVYEKKGETQKAMETYRKALEKKLK
jgi:tetratricopeptide (TPR) repeat protein